ncbi:MAG TPA: hypothetical protein VN703_09070 [Candidatus Sulfopaludibacter sp.]|jgi:hypothetical protein|nr:hypothetical protein [Candidatus Sulfopaludibacter sp.]
MKSKKLIFYALFLTFFVIYIPQLAFGQQNNSIPINQSLTKNTSRPIDLSGLYLSNNQDKYFLKQVGNSLWWLGINKNNSQVENIFKGIINGNNIIGQWIGSPLKKTIDNGSMKLSISYNSDKNITINKIYSYNKFPINQLIKFNPNIKATPKFMVAIDSIHVLVPRSPIYDVITAGLSVKKGDNDPVAGAEYLASRETNANVTPNLILGPFEINKKDNSLTIEYLGMNKDDSSVSSMLINLKETLIQLSDPSFNSYDISNPDQADSLISSVSPGLLSNGCNGVVFADKISIPLQDLKKILTSGTYSQEKTYLGTESPPGCGPISKYQVKWSIVPIQ